MVGLYVAFALRAAPAEWRAKFADEFCGVYLNLEGGNPKARFNDLENAAGSLKCISSVTCLIVFFEPWSIRAAWFMRSCQRDR